MHDFCLENKQTAFHRMQENDKLFSKSNKNSNVYYFGVIIFVTTKIFSKLFSFLSFVSIYTQKMHFKCCWFFALLEKILKY